MVVQATAIAEKVFWEFRPNVIGMNLFIIYSIDDEY
jgi:hypothetical protein